MDEAREVTITIRGKNLTPEAFSAARRDLAGVSAESDKASLAATRLGSAFKLMAGAFSIGAITSAISSYADLTGELTDLSAKTGIGVEALQRLKYAAEQNGGSLDQVTGAISKLGANLAGGNKSAVGALDALGLSFANIRGMAPDQAFTTIADSVAKVQDPMAQAKLAMDLFGKSGADLLPMMKGNLSETADAASRLGIVLSAEAVAAGDEFGDTMGTLGQVGKALIAQVLEPIIPVLSTVAQWLGEKLPSAVSFIVDALTTGLGRAFLDTKLWLDEFLLSVAEGVNSIPLLGKQIGFSAQTIQGLRRDVATAKLAIEDFAKETISNGATQEKAARSISTLTLKYGDNEKAVGKAAAAAEKARLEGTIWGSGLSDFDHLMADHNITIGDYVTAADLAARAADDTNAQLERLGGTVIVIGPQLTNSLTLPWTQFAAAVAAESPKAVRSFDSMAAAVQNMGNTILGALQGGGNVLQSVGASMGNALGKDLASNFGTQIEKKLGDTLGGAVKAVLPGVGALLGPLIGKLGSLFSNKNTEEVRAYNVQIGQVRDTLIEQHGTLDQLEAKALSVGMSFKDAWGHQGQEGLTAMNGLAREFKSRWDSLNDTLATTRGELDAVIKRGSDLGYSFDENGNLVNVSFEKMQEAAEKYGVKLEGLGRSFQSARLQASAEELINTFTLLDKGGTDTGTILVGMKDEINAIVNDSMKFGTEIPENMRPWIKNLIDTGNLTDKNGDKMKDLTGIKFGEPVATEFEKISTKIGTLIDAIAVLVDRINTTITPAIDHATRDRTIRIGFDVDAPPEIDVTGGGRPEYTTGTYGVHGIDFPDFGSGGREVIVHNREAIVPERDKISTAIRWLGGQASAPQGPSAVNVQLHVAIDPQTGSGRVMGLDERLQIQRWLDAGYFRIPARNVSGTRI